MTDVKKNSRVCASDRYNKKNYESVGLRVRKGTRERWRVFADSMGFSLAKLVVLAVDAYIAQQQQQPDQQQPDQQQPDQQQPDQQQQFFRHTSLSDLPFFSASSLSTLADLGVFTIGDYVSRYYDDELDDYMTVIESDKLADLIFENHLW